VLHLRSIVVTGAAGFIGSHLCERLVADGYDVHGIDDFSHGDPLNLTPVQGSAAFRFTRGDCRDARLMRRLRENGSLDPGVRIHHGRKP